MIARLDCSAEALQRLHELAGMGAVSVAGVAEIEFREVPYFLVSRSREQWTEGRGDINAVRVLSVTDLGVVVDPASDPRAQAARRTIIPWTNVISLTVGPANNDSGVRDSS